VPLSFPASPTVGETSTQNGRQYAWTGFAWELVASSDDARWDYFLPPAPTSVTATPGNAQAEVSWTAPTVLAQTPITDYVVQFSSDSGSSWTTFTDGTSTSTSATVTGLTNDTAYVFRVAGVNGIGTGAFSSASSAVTPVAAVSFTAIPVMTSATAPSGTVSDSGILEEAAPSWHAFNKANVSDSTQIYASPIPALNNWIQYDFGFQSQANGYQITSRQSAPFGSTQAPPSWTVSGSNDGTSFTTIDTRSSQTWTSTGEQKSFSFASSATYRYWRWTWGSHDTTVALPKIQLTA